MAVNVVITDRKVFTLYGNGNNYASNTSDYTTYLRGGVMNVQKAVYTVEIDWETLANDTNGITFSTDGNKLIRNNGSWISDGFSIGDIIDFSGLIPVGGFIDRVITNITDTLIIFDGAAEPQQSYDVSFLQGGKTDLFALEYSFGIVENTAVNSLYQSLLDQSDQTYYAADIGLDTGGGRSTSFVDMQPKTNSILGWDSSRTGQTRVRFVSRPSTYVQEFEIEHEYIINPYNDSGLLDQNKSFKYVSKFDFRADLPNINTSKVAEDDIQLGSVGWFDENYDGYNNDFTVSDLVYTDVATASVVQELNISSRTMVECTINSASGLFNNGDPFVLYNSYMPEFNIYNKSPLTYRETWMFYAYSGLIGAASADSGAFYNMVISYISVNEIKVSFEVELPSPQQLRLEEGLLYRLAIEVGNGDTSTQPDNVTLLIDSNAYSKDSNITDLIISDEFGFNCYSGFISPIGDLFKAYRGWIEDEIVSYHRFGVNRTVGKDAEILGAKFKLVAYEDATGETFDLQEEELDLSSQLSAPPGTVNANPFTIQLITDSRTRGYRLPLGDEFNLLLFETEDNDGTYQYYEWRIGLKMNWQYWIALPGADNIFIDTSDTYQGKNNRASNYSLKNGWSIRVDWQFEMQGIDDEGNEGETEYNFFTEAFEILDFDEQDGDPTIWACEIFTFDENDNNLGGDILTNETSKIKAIFTPSPPFTITDAADYWGILRLAEQLQQGFVNDVISTTKPFLTDNKVIPLDGETQATLTLVANTLELDARVDFNRIKDNIGHKISGRLKSLVVPPVVTQWTFKTQSDIPTDGTFDPMVVASGGEVPTWTLIAGYNQTTISFSKSDRAGLDVSELDGSCQNVVVSFSTNDPTNIDEINANDDQICQALDLSLFTDATIFEFADNPALTSVAFPTSTALMSILDFDNTGLTNALDLSVFTNLGGSIIFSDTGITGVTFPSTTEVFIEFDFSNANLTGALSVTNLSKLGGTFRTFSNPNLTSITFPSTTEVFTVLAVHASDITGVLNLSPLSNLGGSIQMYSNPNMTGITFPSSTQNFTIIRFNNTGVTTIDLSPLNTVSGLIWGYSCSSLTSATFPTTTGLVTSLLFNNSNLNGVVDLSGMSNLGGSLRFQSNPNLTSLTLPTSPTVFNEIWAQSCNVNYIDFTVLTGTNDGIYIRLEQNGMTAAEVNRILVDLDGTGWINGQLDIDGSNAAPDGTSGGYDGLTAKSNLQGNGWTVNTN